MTGQGSGAAVSQKQSKNEHRFGVFALESLWKTVQLVTCELPLGGAESEHLRSDIWQGSPLKALPEILLLF